MRGHQHKHRLHLRAAGELAFFPGLLQPLGCGLFCLFAGLLACAHDVAWLPVQQISGQQATPGRGQVEMTNQLGTLDSLCPTECERDGGVKVVNGCWLRVEGDPNAESCQTRSFPCPHRMKTGILPKGTKGIKMEGKLWAQSRWRQELFSVCRVRCAFGHVLPGFASCKWLITRHCSPSPAFLPP